MVFTLHRYILRELLKVFLLAAVALTLILSLGSVLRPIQEYGVGPGQVLNLMTYFLPITLTFVLPMAALFASSLVYGRIASDNEFDACRASGISLWTLVYPGMVLAILVAIANLLLSFHILPHFVLKAEASVKADAKQILFRNIQRTGFYKLRPWLIYADNADLQTGLLTGVVVTRTGNRGLDEVFVADRARVKFSPRQGINEVEIYVENAFQLGPEDQDMFSTTQAAIRTEFGPLLSDAIKFKRIGDMKAIRADLMRFRPIDQLARQAYAQFATELLADEITSVIAAGPDAYYRLHSAEKFVLFRADSVTVGNERVKLLGDIQVLESDIAQPAAPLRMKPSKASIHIEGNRLAPTLTMDLRNVLITETGELPMRHVIRGLVQPPESDVRRRFATQNVLLALERAFKNNILKNGPSEQLIDTLRLLERKKLQTLVKIKAEIHSRLAFGIGCVPMILIGIGLGIIKRGGHLLSAFGASCLPAAVLVVCIIGGKQVTENLGSSQTWGMILIWAGFAFLLLLAAVIYRILLKH